MSPSQTPERRRRGRGFRIFAALALGLVLAVLLAEGAHRILMRTRGRPYRAAGARTAMELALANVDSFVPELAGKKDDPAADTEEQPAQADDAAQRPVRERPVRDRKERVLHPYTGYEMVGVLETLDLDLKRLHSGDWDDAFEILILGGSFAQMFGNLPRQQGGSGVLETVLKADTRFADRRIHFLRFGRGGFKQPQQLITLTWLLSLGFEPDAVINLDGFNEVALANANIVDGTHPGYPSIAHWAHLVQSAPDAGSLELMLDVVRRRDEMRRRLERALHWQLWRSSFLGKRILQDVEEDRRYLAETQQRYQKRLLARAGALSKGPWMSPDTPEPLADAVRVWAENSRMMRAICDARGIFYMHILQPTLHDPGAKRMTERERRSGTIGPKWRKGVLTGYPLLRAAGQELASEGLHFVDGSKFFADVTESIYYDMCHVGLRGNEILAHAVGAAFLAVYPSE